MRFEVHAADRETGEKCVLTFTASTADEATAKANAAGYLVSEVIVLVGGRGSGGGEGLMPFN